jgi:hypothetical protein
LDEARCSLALRYKLIAIFLTREFLNAGGVCLMQAGLPSRIDRQCGSHSKATPKKSLSRQTKAASADGTKIIKGQVEVQGQ